MIIYRVEHEESRSGPYNQECKEVHEEHNYGESRPAHPSPSEDSIFFKEKDIFGCPSLELLRTWFEPWSAKPLARDGFVVAAYTIDEGLVKVSSSGMQCAFPRQCATLVDERDVLATLSQQRP